MKNPIVLEKIKGILSVCDDVLDEYNAKKISLEQLNARMVLLSKMLNKLEAEVNNV